MGADQAISVIEDEYDVSRETLQRLHAFAELLTKWNGKINLVSPASLPDLWQRHILDSAQLMPHLPQVAKTVVDIGTGGGFPGLILAILAHELRPDLVVTMIESDGRKCAFLQTASHQLGLKTKVISKRIEQVPSLGADVLTSRALAPVIQLFSHAERHLGHSGTALLLKGKNAANEVEEALASYAFDLQNIPSRTSEDALVLKISNLRPR